ncbi:MAG TPA: hypothetical protein VFZ83_02380 [Acidimicrobiia bacterium]|nr:hypothetical protein [Acidimicrobiia bacterium]
MRKLLGVAISSALLVVAMSAPAFAGEITGKGKPTPVKGHIAASICSFSGLNDDPNEPGDFNGGQVQSFGDIVQEAIGLYGDGKGASSLTPIITGDGPGVNCRGGGPEE